MNRSSARDRLDVSGRITAREFTVNELRRQIDGWDALDDEEKHRHLRLRPELARSRTRTDNIAVDGLLAHVAASLDPTGTADAAASYLALGDNDTAPEATNETINNEVYRTGVGDAQPDGADLLTSTFLSQTEANGETIREVGLAAGPDESDTLLTHATLETGEEIEKNSSMVVTIDYVLEFRREA